MTYNGGTIEIFNTKVPLVISGTSRWEMYSGTKTLSFLKHLLCHFNYK